MKRSVLIIGALMLTMLSACSNDDGKQIAKPEIVQPGTYISNAVSQPDDNTAQQELEQSDSQDLSENPVRVMVSPSSDIDSIETASADSSNEVKPDVDSTKSYEDEKAENQQNEEISRSVSEGSNTNEEGYAAIVVSNVVEPSVETSDLSIGRNHGGDAANFDLYNNVDQQNTDAEYVLNLSTGKFHKPKCRDVPKIKEENYEEAWGKTRDELIAEGFSPCDHCNP